MAKRPRCGARKMKRLDLDKEFCLLMDELRNELEPMFDKIHHSPAKIYILCDDLAELDGLKSSAIREKFDASSISTPSLLDII